nr:hypothetical protein Iba_chr04aCG16750 [Ipomoea batatas]
MRPLLFGIRAILHDKKVLSVEDLVDITHEGLVGNIPKKKCHQTHRLKLAPKRPRNQPQGDMAGRNPKNDNHRSGELVGEYS